MAWDFINLGIEAGNKSMEHLDAEVEKLNVDLGRIARQLDEELQSGVNSNHETIKVNQIILYCSVPVVLLFFGAFIGKIGLLLKREMDSLGQRTTQLNTILDTAASAIITIDKNGVILSFNHAAERIFGFTLKEIVGENVNKLMPRTVAELHDSYLRRYVESQESHVLGKRRELEAKRKNGESFPILLRVNPMTIDGELFFSGVIDDISETKTLQTQLVQAQKLEAIGQLASGVAHEINTPIQYIGDNLSALSDNFSEIIAFQNELRELLGGNQGLGDEFDALCDRHDLEFILEDSPKAIKQAQDGVKRVAEIVKAMKTFSHIESSQGKQLINLNEALNSALTISRNNYKYVAEIETDFSPDVELVECYASELNQVFLNMIINATHAIEEKHSGMGLIRLVTRKLENDYIEILIADNGAGIPEVVQEKVFNLFFTTKAVGKGTGQGLSLAHNIIVEKHQGKLFFESTVGVGTTFHIQLPIQVI